VDKDIGRSPDGSGHSATPEPVVSALRASVPNAFETLDQFADRTGVPREGSDPGAVEWIATRLSPKQLAALEGFPAPNRHFFADEIGTSGNTLYSLLDFARSKRDCLAPLMLVYREYEPSDHAYTWSMTDLGLRVMCAAQAIEARRAETLQDGSVHESAVPKGCAHD
jgi:hypothetical protein